MKKKVIKLDTALSLDKNTIAKLNDEQLGALEGGKTIASATCNGGIAPDEQPGAMANSCGACSCNTGPAAE